MCVKLKSSKISPGYISTYQTRSGKASGSWGFENGRQYNVRLESLNTYWKNLKSNRGIISVDSFWEDKVEFVPKSEKLFNIGVIYNDKGEFSVITCPANDIVKTYHDRMPLVLNKEGIESFLTGEEPKLLELDQFKIAA